MRAQRSLPDQDILQYLNQTIAWYRDVLTFIQAQEGAHEIDDRISRAVIREIESEPHFKALNGGAPKVEMKAG